MQALGEHLSTGHLTMTEYTERADSAAAARKLDALFTDLPGPHQRRPGPPSPTTGFPPTAPAPFGADAYGRPLSDKNRWAAGVLQVVLPFGVGRFYTGQVGLGVAQLLVTLLTGIGLLWSFIDGILILVQGGVDKHGRQLRS